MIDKFLRAKHWQLFIIILGIPLIFQLYLMNSIFSEVFAGNEPNVDYMLDFMKYYPIVMILVIGTLFGWMWSISMGLRSKIPEELRPATNLFRIFFFVPLVYLIGLAYLMSTFFQGFMELAATNTPPDIDPSIFDIATFIVPLHLFSIFCMFYCFYFTAKTFKTAELQKAVTFSDFIGEFFLVWFSPIGVWIIQPKVNEMVDEYEFI